MRAIDIALHDLAGKVAGVPVHELLGLSADLPPTDFTIGIDEPAIVAERAAAREPISRRSRSRSAAGDLATLRAVRDVYDGPIRVDANTGWTRDEAVALLPELVDLGVELIEQPFPARRLDDLRLAPGALEPADRRRRERRHDRGPRGAGGRRRRGQRQAREVRRHRPRRTDARGGARELGFRTFLGCMEETSVGIAASAAVASLADWVDLDGNLLLADDPFEGLELGPDKRWHPAERPGLGLTRRGA